MTTTMARSPRPSQRTTERLLRPQAIHLHKELLEVSKTRQSSSTWVASYGSEAFSPHSTQAKTAPLQRDAILRVVESFGPGRAVGGRRRRAAARVAHVAVEINKDPSGQSWKAPRESASKIPSPCGDPAGFHRSTSANRITMEKLCAFVQLQNRSDCASGCRRTANCRQMRRIKLAYSARRHPGARSRRLAHFCTS